MSGYRQLSRRDQSNEEWLEEYDGKVLEVRPRQAPANEGGECLVDSAPLVPEGEYKIAYVEHTTQKAKGTGKLNINFSIKEGEYSGVILPFYYRVTLTGPPGKSGSFKASAQGEYFEQMCDLIPALITGRTDRISPQRLKGETVLAEVVTVTTKWSGEQRKEHTQYSKVKKLIRLC